MAPTFCVLEAVAPLSYRSYAMIGDTFWLIRQMRLL